MLFIDMESWIKHSERVCGFGYWKYNVYTIVHPFSDLLRTGSITLDDHYNYIVCHNCVYSVSKSKTRTRCTVHHLTI